MTQKIAAAHPSQRGAVLVTGADGTIGRATVSHLASCGWRVTALSLGFTGGFSGSVRLIEGDATSESAVEDALEGVSAVVHLAALPHWESGTPRQVYVTNVVSTFTVLTQAAARGIHHAVFASSIHASGVAGNHHQPMPSYFPLDENMPIAHDEWYSLSKYSDELTAAMVTSRWGMPTTGFRFPLVNDASVLERVAREWSAEPELGLRLGWSYLDVRDAARAIGSALELRPKGATVMHVAAPTTLMSSDTDALLDLYAPSVPRRRAFEGRTVPVDLSRARRLIGFSAEHHIVPPSSKLSAPRVGV